MIPTPAGYAALMASSHHVTASVSILVDGQTVRDDLPVLGGSVSMSRTADVRRYCTLDLMLDPNTFSMLLPYGNELAVFLTVTAGTATPAVGTQTGTLTVIPGHTGGLLGLGTVTTTVSTPAPVVTGPAPLSARFPLGVFRIANPRIDDAGSPTLTVVGYDRSRALQRAKFVVPYAIPAGTNYVAAIQTLVQNRAPGIQTFDVPTSSATTPLLVFDADTDPWAAVLHMATALGMEAYFDASGTFVLRDEPDPTQDPITWTYTEGTGGTLLGTVRDISDDPGYNGVIVVGESTSNVIPIRRVVWDTDPTSPTYYAGPYGQVPFVMNSQYIHTVEQADAAGAAQLLRELGLTEAVQVTAVPNPAQELGDTVELVRAASGVAGHHLVQSLEMPLSPADPMTIETRSRRRIVPDDPAAPPPVPGASIVFGAGGGTYGTSTTRVANNAAGNVASQQQPTDISGTVSSGLRSHAWFAYFQPAEAPHWTSGGTADFGGNLVPSTDTVVVSIAGGSTNPAVYPLTAGELTTLTSQVATFCGQIPSRSGPVYICPLQEPVDDMTGAAYVAMANAIYAGIPGGRPELVKAIHITEYHLRTGSTMNNGGVMADYVPPACQHISWSSFSQKPGGITAQSCVDRMVAFMAGYPAMTWGVGSCAMKLTPGYPASDSLARKAWVTEFLVGIKATSAKHFMWWEVLDAYDRRVWFDPNLSAAWLAQVPQA